QELDNIEEVIFGVPCSLLFDRPQVPLADGKQYLEIDVTDHPGNLTSVYAVVSEGFGEVPIRSHLAEDARKQINDFNEGQTCKVRVGSLALRVVPVSHGTSKVCCLSNVYVCLNRRIISPAPHSITQRINWRKRCSNMDSN